MNSSLLSSLLPALLLSTLEVHPSDASPATSSAFVGLPSFQSSQSITAATSSSLFGGSKYSHFATTTTRLCASSGSGFGSDNKKKKRRTYDSDGAEWLSSTQSTSTASSSSSTRELFELQELRAQLETIRKDGILLQNLSKEKRDELSEYVKAVVERIDSPIDFKGKGGNTMGVAQFVAAVENKSWRMVFSTDGNSGGDGTEDGGAVGGAGELPYGSTVLLRIGEFLGTDGNLDYVLKFGKKIMGLNELVAKSTCSVDIGPINPGVFTFEYKDIKTNIFGISDLPVGFFGLLKGRVNLIDTVWFDGERWIERTYLGNGDVAYNVYVRDEDDEKNA